MAKSALAYYADGGEVDDYNDADTSDDSGGAGTLESLGEAPSDSQIAELRNYGRSLAGDPSEVRGALEQGQAGVDRATAEKSARIKQAHDILAASGHGNVNLPLFAAAVGMLSPAQNFGQALGNAGRAALPVLQQGRQAEIDKALQLGGLDVQGADVGVQAAKERQNFLDKRLSLGQQALTSAARLEAQKQQWQRNYDRDIKQAQLTAAYRKQVQDRLAANAEQGRYTWQPGVGPDPQNPEKQVQGAWQFATKGDEPPKFHSGVVVTGRPGSGGGGTPVFTLKKQAWLAIHPGDEQGALDYAAGHKQLGPEESLKFAYQQARSEASAAALATGRAPSPDDIDQRARAIASTLGATAAKEPIATGTPSPTGFRIPTALPAKTGAPQPGQAAPAPLVAPASAAPAAAPAAAPTPTVADLAAWAKRRVELGLPDKSAYSAARDMWRTPDGKFYDNKTGKPIGG